MFLCFGKKKKKKKTQKKYDTEWRTAVKVLSPYKLRVYLCSERFCLSAYSHLREIEEFCIPTLAYKMEILSTKENDLFFPFPRGKCVQTIENGAAWKSQQFSSIP